MLLVDIGARIVYDELEAVEDLDASAVLSAEQPANDSHVRVTLLQSDTSDMI